ncbi:MAG: DUF2231 domain-containing protein [Bauldia sp.]
MIPTEHIHPMLVHFPIVFFLCLTAIDLVALIRGKSVTGRTALGNLSSGLAVVAGISAIVTWFFGGLALDLAEAGGFRSDVAETHEGLGTATAAVFVLWAIVRAILWWRNTRGGRAMLSGVAVVEILGVFLVSLTAYFGGELVYGLGVNVSRAVGG